MCVFIFSLLFRRSLTSPRPDTLFPFPPLFLSAPLGCVLVLHLLGIPVSMPVYIGLLMLFGIVAKNSILLVDFAIEEMRMGKDRMQAMLERSEEHTSELQSLMRISYAVF